MFLKQLHILIYLILLATGNAQAAPVANSTGMLTFGITQAVAHNQYALLDAWRIYLSRTLKRAVVFIYRDRLQECIDLMKQGELDFAWVSSPAYLENRSRLDLLVSPLYKGHSFEQAYLIVPSSDQATHNLIDMKNKVFVYVDKLSNTGYLAPRTQLEQDNIDPDHFFKKTFYTRDPVKIIAAVAIGLADGGSVSGFTWDTLALTRPDITQHTRIAAKSTTFALPPLVARHTLDKTDYKLMQRVLLEMKNNTEGAKLLTSLNLDGFASPDKHLYRNIEKMMQP
jgi:phosphonate transport system substrate-binding protein